MTGLTLRDALAGLPGTGRGITGVGRAVAVAGADGLGTRTAVGAIPPICC